MIVPGGDMLHKNEDFDEEFSNISDAFKHKIQVRLMVNLAGAKTGDIDNMQNIQNRFLSNLPALVKAGAIYEVTPQIALETNRAGFSTIIKQNSEAEMVLDENRLPLQNNRPNPCVVHLGQLTEHRQ